MQVPWYIFTLSILLALSWSEMASLLLKRAGSTAGTARFTLSPPASIKRFLPTLFSTNPSPNLQQRPFSTTNTKAASNMSSQFLETLKNRRTIYQLAKSSTIPDSKVQEIIKEIVLHVPHSFNSQSTRVILLVKEEHDKLWEIAKTVLKGVVPADGWAGTEARLNGFQAAYGTVLFFEARSAVQAMQDKLPLYADRFPVWASQSGGMSQYALWTALEAEGLGCNLQHYNPLIDQKVAEEWGVDKDWELNAQLVFGKPEGGPMEKTFLPVEDRFKTFGV